VSDCVFCKLVAGEFPAAVILEDDVAFAFMDIGPVAEGHVLLIPKKHYVTVDEMPDDEAGRLLRHIPALVRAVQTATKAEGVNVLQNNGVAAHQEVPHVHFHIIPRHAGDDWKWNWPAKAYADGQMTELTDAIRGAL